MRVRYGRREVIGGLNLSGIRRGSLTALVGPNAAGKSTLLKALAGLLPASGSIRLGGADLQRLSLTERAARVAFMPQQIPVGVSLTVLEAAMAALKATPTGDAADPSDRAVLSRAMAVLSRFGIAELALEPLDRLSGGQRQLASLAQAVVREPELLLLDEPTSALDLKHQLRVMRIVREIASSSRMVVAVLHDLALAAQFADRIVVLSQGAVRADGPPEAAVTHTMLRDVYGVLARVERCSQGRLQIMVDGESPTQDNYA
nr:ABC transporter ATP-binding protein [Aurantimonas endophytica]